MKFLEKLFITISILSSLVLVGLLFVVAWQKKQGVFEDFLVSAKEENSEQRFTEEIESDATLGAAVLPIETETETETTTADPYPYYIRVNRTGNCVTIYTKDEEGEYTVPYKAMICSTEIGRAHV